MKLRLRSGVKAPVAVMGLILLPIFAAAQPTVTSINRLDPNPTNAASVRWQFTTNQLVSGADVADFATTVTGGLTGTSITSVVPIEQGTMIFGGGGTPSGFNIVRRIGTNNNEAGIDPETNEGDFTIEFWFRTSAFQDNGAEDDNDWRFGFGMVDAGESGPQDDFGVTFNRGQVMFGSGSGAGSTCQSAGTFSDGVWRHVAARRDMSSGLMELFINGVEVTDSNVTVNANVDLDASTDIDIGGKSYDVRYFDGEMDEVRIWCTRRTDAEIQQSMTSGVTGTETGLLEYYKMDQFENLGINADGTDDVRDFATTTNGLTDGSNTANHGDAFGTQPTQGTFGGTTSRWIVTAGTGPGSQAGTIRADLMDNNTIINAASQPIGGAGTQNFTTGEVYTIDRLAPTLSSVTMTSNNTPSTHARVGSTITVTFSSAENLSGVVVLIGGQPAVLSGGPTNWTATRVLTGTETQGAATLSISYNDTLGNTGNTTTVTSGTTPIIDTVAPAHGTRSIASSGANALFAKVGDTITVTIDANEDIQPISGTIGGTAGTAGGTAGVRTLSRVMTGTDTEGVVAFSVNAIVDIAGNTGTGTTSVSDGSSVTFDRTNPTVVTASITSNNANPNLAVPGNTVTLTFTASEQLQTPTVLIGGRTATVSGGPTSWTATLVINGTEPPGPLSISGSILDRASNAGSTLNNTTNGSSVSTDLTPPSYGVISIVSSGADPTWAKVGDTITVTINASESTQTPTVNIAGHSAVITGGPAAWTATNVMVAGDTEGVVTFTAAVNDLAGNAGPAINGSNNGSSVTFDKTAPTLPTVTMTSNNSNPAFANAGDMITVSFTASESLKNTPAASIAGQAASVSGGPGSWTATYTLAGSETAGPIAFSINPYADLASNNGSAVTGVTSGSAVTADFTSPSLGTVSISSSNSDPTQAAVGDTVTVNFTSSENLAGTVVLIGGQPAIITGGPTNWTATRVIDGTETEGPATVSISYNDLAGNTGTPGGVNDGSAVNLDFTAPVLIPVSWSSSNANPAFAKPGDTVTVFFTSDEDLDGATVLIAGQPAILTGGPTNWQATYTLTGTETEGPLTFTINPYDDLAGNVGTPVSASTDGSAVTFDSTSPSISAVIRNDAATTDRDAVTFTVTFSEPVGNSFSVSDLVLSGSVAGGAALYLAGPSADPVFTVIVGMNNTSGNGAVGINLTGTVTDQAGNPFTMSTSASQNTMLNYSSADVNKNGVVDLVDVALLSDYNLGLVGSLP